jgi:hypothetical protein
MTGREWPMLLKKSAMVSTAEKYALEFEIFIFRRGFRTQFSRGCARKRHFQQPVREQLGRTDFFNSIGQKRPLEGVYETRDDSISRPGIAKCIVFVAR